MVDTFCRSTTLQFTRTIINTTMFSKLSVVFAALLSTYVIAAPITTSDLSTSSNFSYNVVMTSGAAQFAMWVPTDGSAYSSSSISCLNVGSSAIGSCSISSIDQVAVINGYTCFFSGSNGWSGSQAGSSSSGWMKVSPPQTIVAVACMSS